MMHPAFLKSRKWPRVAPPMEEKSYGLSASDKLDQHCTEELMEAMGSKDVKRFRSALEALIMNMFEEQEEQPDGAA